MNNRFLRVVVCLLVICCLIVNMSPIRANAAFVSGSVAIGSAAVIAAVLIGLGLSSGTAMDDFNALVSNLQSYLATLGWIVDGLITVKSIVSGASMKYAVPQNLIEDVRDFIIDTAVCVYQDVYLSSSVISSKYSSVDSSVKAKMQEAMSYGYIIINKSWSYKWNYYVVVSNAPFSSYVNAQGYTTFIASDGSSLLYSFDGGAWSTRSEIAWGSSGEYIEFYVGTGVNTVTSSYDLTIGNVSIDNTALEDAYSDWASTAFVVSESVVDTETAVETVVDTTYWQVVVADTYEETAALTQTQVQTGVAVDDSYVGVDSTTETTGFLSNILIWLQSVWEAIISIPASIVSGITDFFTFSTDLSTYAVELTSFFPFCVPWDIYNFFALFLAEPEAPCLEFDIDFPYMNEPWHIVIDLSAWDTVATVLRTLELVLFIVGLAMVTREKFLRG